MTKENLSQEIGDMLAGLEEPEENEETPPEETPLEKPPEETPPEETPPEEEPPEKKPPEEEPPEEEPPGEEPPEEEPPKEKPSEELQAMRDRIEELSGLLLQSGVKVPGKETPPKPAGEEPPKPAEIKKMSLEELKVLADDLDFDDFVNDRETFEKTMKATLSRFAEVINNTVLENVTSRMPDVVANQVRQVSALNKAVDDFYSTNPDLKGVRKTVGAVADQIVLENPNLTMEDVMSQAAVKTRELLKLPAPKGEGKVVKPSFAKQKGKGKKQEPEQKVSKLQSEIDDLID